MEFKKKTIIWEDNNEPPHNYLWVKNGIVLEYDPIEHWKESEEIQLKTSENSYIEKYRTGVNAIIKQYGFNSIEDVPTVDELINNKITGNYVAFISNETYWETVKQSHGSLQKTIADDWGATISASINILCIVISEDNIPSGYLAACTIDYFTPR